MKKERLVIKSIENVFSLLKNNIYQYVGFQKKIPFRLKLKYKFNKKLIAKISNEWEKFKNCGCSNMDDFWIKIIIRGRIEALPKMLDRFYVLFLIENKIIRGTNIPYSKFIFIDEITKKLFDCHTVENRMFYAKVIASEIDSNMAVLYDDIQDYEEKYNLNFVYIKQDIGFFLRAIHETFSKFEIDIMSILSQNSDFEKYGGNYNEYITTETPNLDLFFPEFINDESKKTLIESISKLGYFDNTEIRKFAILLSGQKPVEKINTNKTTKELIELLYVLKDDLNVSQNSELKEFIVDNFLSKNKKISRKTIENNISNSFKFKSRDELLGV